MSMKHILLTCFAAITLSACGNGGGGAGGNDPGPGAELGTTYFNTLRTATVTYTDASKSTIASVLTGTTGYTVGQHYYSGNFYKSFTINNSVNTLSADFSSVSQPALAYSATPNSGLDYVAMGGTSHQYSRYGQYVDKNSLDSTRSEVRLVPFFNYKGNLASSAAAGTYANAGKAIGMYATGSAYDEFACDVSVSLSASGASQIANVSLSGCTSTTSSAASTYASSGQMTITRTPSSTSPTGYVYTTTGSNLSVTVGAGGAQAVFAPDVRSGDFFVIGPNAEEVVGEIELTKTNNNFVVLTFGAKK